METIREYIEKKRARLLTEIKDDDQRKDDPIIGQFMKGRLVVENYYLETLENILEMIKDLD